MTGGTKEKPGIVCFFLPLSSYLCATKKTADIKLTYHND